VQLQEEKARLEARLQEFQTIFEAEKLNIQNTRGTVLRNGRPRLRQLQEEMSKAGQALDQLLRHRPRNGRG